MNILNIKNYKELSNFPIKILLSYNILPITLLSKDPILKLLSNLTEINKIIDITGYEITKFLYYHIENVHNLLYEKEDIIFLSSDKFDSQILSSYFYLSLLINNNLNIINFNYSFDLIKNLDNLQIDNFLQIKEIIRSRIIIDLIKNFKETDDYNKDKFEQKLFEIENKYMNKNNFVKELSLNSNKDISIEEIYINIINGLIIKDKFDNYNYVYNIIEQLDLKSIDITSKLFEALILILADNIYINKYLISNINDLFIIKKINFNYIFLKYLL